ncbi:hydrogenase 4 subunit F [Microaerobacter geothermalis]|uniref:hydrogenase 4 subunit F n=1 Tax=Microaerobacter geothermalis TaxID=674972 RepID=UPI001F2EB5FE|nr:hydrogenase 4 subunit F [Microaerobacter geothermalis]MCF6093065.1 hydrogenase 4 subunit F [Microaerobacter geothermalis]
MSFILTLLIAPIITGLLTWSISHRKTANLIHLVGSLVTLGSGLILSYMVFIGNPIVNGNRFIYVDSLSALLIVIITVVGFTASLFSIGYMGRELAEGVISEKEYHRYYLWFHLFISTMLAVVITNNIGFMWIAIESTTLVSALLVAFYRKGNALEAAWKYMIMGSLGIALALLGVIFLYTSGLDFLGKEETALNWTTLAETASQLNPQWVEWAFIFILVGFGTKAGLAPLHFWLPDAHSQAPSPISAVLSGVLLNTALYGIIRIFIIANQTLDGGAEKWLLAFGLFSVAITVPFILVQHDFKRMLAYSSVEHIGVITLGLGIGGTLGFFGALLHMFNHSMAKSLMFLAAGNVNQKFHTKMMDRISGVVKAMPVSGPVLLMGTFALSGVPPFSIFLSEFTIMLAGFREGKAWASILLIIFIVFIFSGMIYYISKMVFGNRPVKVEKGEISHWSSAALFIPLIFIILLGIYIPPFFQESLGKITILLKGGQ